jgi:VanZ family protein
MKKMKKWFLWILVILWMINILFFSSQPSDISKKQSGYFVTFAQNIIQVIESRLNLKPINPEQLTHFIRKTAHVFNYFFLTLLLIFAWMETYRKKEQIKTFSWMIASIFSVIDEIFQTFVPGRSGMFRDVLIDQIGTIMALLLIYLVLKKQPIFEEH